MAGFEEKKAEVGELGISVYAASVDTGEKAEEVASGLSFSIGQGLNRETGEALRAWWDPKRGFVQPTEFVTRGDGTIVQASYSDGPIARTLADDVISMVKIYKNAER